MTSISMPTPNQKVTDGQGTISQPWWRFFFSLYQLTNPAVATNQISIFDFIPESEISAIVNGTSTTDVGPYFNMALAEAAGRYLYVPAGSYYIETPIVYSTNSSSVFSSGLRLLGEGSVNTILKNAVAGIQLLNVFDTTLGSSVVTMHWPNHGKSVGDVITITNVGSHAYGGLDMDGNWNVTSVTQNTLTFNNFQGATGTIAATGSCTVTQALLTITTTASLKFQLGGFISGIQIANTTSPVGSSGIMIRRCYQLTLDDIWINGATCDGINVPCVQGDQDGCSQLNFVKARINSCGRWGIDIAGSQTTVAGVLVGYNEISNTIFGQVFVDGCGFSQASFAYGGGIKWKGQGLQILSTALTTNTNVGIYIPGGAGLGSGFTFNFLVLENNKSCSFYVAGLDTMVGQTLEMYNNDAFTATSGLRLDGSSYVVKNINIQSSIIRATAGNSPITEFVGTGPNLGTVRIYEPSFQNFGHPGQTEASGIAFLP